MRSAILPCCGVHPYEVDPLSSIPEPHHLAALRPIRPDADRAAVKWRQKTRARHVGADLFQQRLDAEIDPAAEARVVVRRQIELRLEELDQREGFADLALSDGVRLVGDDGDVDGADLLGELAVAVGDRTGA